MSTQPLPEIDESSARRRSPHMVPWIVVGLLAVVALVASIVVVNVVRANDEATEPTPTPTESAPAPTESAPPTPEPEPTEEPDDGVPDVDVGPTFTMAITQWNATSEVSNKLGGDTRYMIEGDTITLTSSVIEQLPQECAAMRTQWGATRTGENKFEVRKPGDRCDAAPELYDEIWGLMAAFADSITTG